MNRTPASFAALKIEEATCTRLETSGNTINNLSMFVNAIFKFEVFSISSNLTNSILEFFLIYGEACTDARFTFVNNFDLKRVFSNAETIPDPILMFPQRTNKLAGTSSPISSVLLFNVDELFCFSILFIVLSLGFPF